MRGLRAVVLAVLLAPALSPSAAEAGSGDAGGQGGVSNGTIVAGVQYGRPPLGKGKADANRCTWVPAGEAGTFEAAVVDTRVVNGVTQALFLRVCPTSNVGVWVSQVSAASLAVNAAALVKQRLPQPTLGSAPDVDTGIVNVGMWLWADSGEYEPVSVTAWVPTLNGIAFTTTTATPVGLVYDPGEPGGSRVACEGPGERWVKGSPDDAVSDCMYTYRHSSEISASGVFDARWSIVWSISWRSNTGVGQNLGEFVTTSDTTVTVREIQAVIVP